MHVERTGREGDREGNRSKGKGENHSFGPEFHGEGMNLSPREVKFSVSGVSVSGLQGGGGVHGGRGAVNSP